MILVLVTLGVKCRESFPSDSKVADCSVIDKSIKLVNNNSAREKEKMRKIGENKKIIDKKNFAVYN